MNETDLQQRFAQASKIRSDYVAIHSKVADMPKKLKYECRVDLGPLAFVPGYVTHTNELLVSLGQNYFAERSASQTCEIISRRIHMLDAEIAVLRERMPLDSQPPQLQSTIAQDHDRVGPREPSSVHVQPIVSQKNIEPHSTPMKPPGGTLKSTDASADTSRSGTGIPTQEPVGVSDAEFQEIWENLDEPSAAQTQVVPIPAPLPRPNALDLKENDIASNAPAISSPKDMYAMISNRMAASAATVNASNQSHANVPLRTNVITVRDAGAMPTAHAPAEPAAEARTAKPRGILKHHVPPTVSAPSPQLVSSADAFSGIIVERSSPAATVPEAEVSVTASPAPVAVQGTDSKVQTSPPKRPMSRFRTSRMQ